jgi:hypothetical protein
MHGLVRQNNVKTKPLAEKKRSLKSSIEATTMKDKEKKGKESIAGKKKKVETNSKMKQTTLFSFMSANSTTTKANTDKDEPDNVEEETGSLIEDSNMLHQAKSAPENRADVEDDEDIVGSASTKSNEHVSEYERPDGAMEDSDEDANLEQPKVKHYLIAG